MTDAAEVVPGAEETPEIDQRACQGPCMAKYRESGKGTVRFGDPLLCPACASQLRNELLEIDTTAGILIAGADGYRKSTGADAAIRAHRNASDSGDPSPAHTMINELDSVLRKWVVLKRPVASRLGAVARSTTELTSWLVRELNLYVYDRDCAGEMAAEVHKWHARLEKRADAGQALIHKPLPCPRCKQKGLEQERRSKVVKCKECGRIMSTEEYDNLAADGAESADGGVAETPKPARRSRKTTAA
jgi:ribosomal protein L37AE/L43A